jgi:quinoprotein glucose dehydrogenase
MRPLLLLVAIFATTQALAQSAPITDYDWPTYANDPGSSKYAPLDQIDAKSMSRLKVAWEWGSPDNEQVKANRALSNLGYKSTPIKIGDALYVNTTLGRIVALDAKTGEERWVFDTETWKSGRPANLGFNTRGVAYWEYDGKRRILMGTNNAYLWSIDADTGRPDAGFGDGGKVDLTQGLGRDVDRSAYSVVSAPLVIGDTVVVGSVVFDLPVFPMVPEKLTDLAPGHVRGFDIATGKQKWIFHSPPQGDEPGTETWENESWKVSGGANVWTLMSADPELGYVYLPFGTPSNDWYGGHRPGDNLYGESLVCLDAETGERVWHFQMVHHGLWDYDLPAAPNLIDITVDGKPIKAVAQISKQGFVYVFDRVTGEPVWPIEERPVPQSSVPGEHTSQTQPVPTKPAAFDLQGITEETLIDFTPELRKEALELIGKFEYGPLYTPPSLKGTIQLPGDGGGGEWTGAAFDPDTSLFYVPSVSRPIVVQLVEQDSEKTEYRYVRGGTSRVRGPKRLPITKPPYGRISAIDLDTGDYEWVVPNSEGIRQRIIDMGIPDPGPVGSIAFISPLLTKSLLFIALADNGKPVLRALDKSTGATLHEVALPGFPNGAPMTYMVDGKQYIALALGGSTDSKIVALALGD